MINSQLWLKDNINLIQTELKKLSVSCNISNSPKELHDKIKEIHKQEIKNLISRLKSCGCFVDQDSAKYFVQFVQIKDKPKDDATKIPLLALLSRKTISSEFCSKTGVKKIFDWNIVV